MAAPTLELKLRTATSTDLDNITAVACAAFPDDPQWDYRFPHRKEFPEDNYKCTKELYKSMLDIDDIVINVITTSTKENNETKEKLIALAVWELQYEKADGSLKIGMSCGLDLLFRSCLLGLRSRRSTASCDDRRDADPKHMKAFKDAVTKAKKKYFDDVYGNQHLHLRILATHPDWQRHGAATMHCDWGMDLADAHKVPVTILSSPMGSKLYSHLGFETLAHFTVQVEGEEEKLSIGVMIRKYEENEDEKQAL